MIAHETVATKQPWLYQKVKDALVNLMLLGVRNTNQRKAKRRKSAESEKNQPGDSGFITEFIRKKIPKFFKKSKPALKSYPSSPNGYFLQGRPCEFNSFMCHKH